MEGQASSNVSGQAPYTDLLNKLDECENTAIRICNGGDDNPNGEMEKILTNLIDVGVTAYDCQECMGKHADDLVAYKSTVQQGAKELLESIQKGKSDCIQLIDEVSANAKKSPEQIRALQSAMRKFVNFIAEKCKNFQQNCLGLEDKSSAELFSGEKATCQQTSEECVHWLEQAVSLTNEAVEKLKVKELEKIQVRAKALTKVLTKTQMIQMAACGHALWCATKELSKNRAIIQRDQEHLDELSNDIQEMNNKLRKLLTAAENSKPPKESILLVLQFEANETERQLSLICGKYKVLHDNAGSQRSSSGIAAGMSFVRAFGSYRQITKLKTIIEPSYWGTLLFGTKGLIHAGTAYACHLDCLQIDEVLCRIRNLLGKSTSHVRTISALFELVRQSGGSEGNASAS